MQRLYLNFGERLSQVYINPYSVATAVVLVKVILLRNLVISLLSDAVDNNQLCTPENTNMLREASKSLLRSLESIISLTANTNLYLFALLIEVVKATVIFAFEVLLGTYTCLLSALVDASANFALDAGTDMVIAVNTTIVAAAEGIQEGVQGLEDVLNSMADGLDAIKNFFTGSILENSSQYHQMIDLNVDALKSVKIPSLVTDSIETFRNDTLPDFSLLLDDISKAIALPFDAVQKSIANALNQTDVETVPPLNVVDPMCELDLDSHTKKLVKTIEVTSKWIIIGLSLVLAALLLVAAYETYSFWRRKQAQLKEMATTSIQDNVVFRYDNPIVYWGHRLRLLPSNTLMWVTEYMALPPALTILFIGIVGLLSCWLQMTMINTAAQAIQQFSNDTADSLASPDFTGLLKLYVDDTNSVIISAESNLNQSVIGHVQEFTYDLNKTVLTFWDTLNGTVNAIFGNTPVIGPVVSTVVYCTIGRKAELIESGLTWINHHIQVNIPRFGEDELDGFADAMGTAKSKSVLISPMEKALQWHKDAVITEAYVLAAFVGLWAFQGVVAITLLSVYRFMQKRNTIKY